MATTSNLLLRKAGLDDLAELPQFRQAIAAQDDEAAFTLWAETTGARSVNTLASYRKESWRLLIWLREHGLSARSLKVEHCLQYARHLQAPPPHWLRPPEARKLRAIDAGTRLP